MQTYESQVVVYGKAFLNALIAAWKAIPTAPLIATAKVRLSTDPLFQPTPGSKITDLVTHEATFTGYPAGGAPLTVGPPVNLSTTCQGSVVPVEYTATDAVNPNTVTGYWVDDGTNVIAGERFAGGETATFAVAGDFLTLVVQLPLQAPQPTV